jgi:hypothetical protein
MLQKLPTPQGEAKGLNTIVKRAQLKFRWKRAPKCMNASSPWTNAFPPIFLPSIAKLPLETWIGYFPPCL